MSADIKAGYARMMTAELSQLVDELELSDLQKKFLKTRWLEQLLWMEDASVKNQRYYYIFRLACIIGGVTIPALIGLKTAGGMGGLVQFFTILISLIVAVSAAIEEFFHFGERWRHYRRTAERLKGEGWSFFQLSRSYQKFKAHADAYPVFAGRIEEAFETELENFISKVSRETAEGKKDNP